MENELEQKIKALKEFIKEKTDLGTANYVGKEIREICGMVEAIRSTTNKGENRGHAVFDNWKESVLDYAFYQARFLGDIKTEGEYIQYLKVNYAEDPGYVDKVIKLSKK